MEIGSLVKQKLYEHYSADGKTKTKDTFRYGVLYKIPHDLDFGWVFWQLDRDGPHAVSNESYCEAVPLSAIELVAGPNY